jgi:hypothetical protein
MTIATKNTESFLHRDKFYFYDFENVDYDFGIDKTELITIKNFLHRFRFVESVKADLSAWSYWTVRDKETPEIISFKIYGTTHMYWLICLFNNIMDYNSDWPKDDIGVYNDAVSKYADLGGVTGIHHYESDVSDDLNAYPAGITVPSTYGYSIIPISNLEYEIKLNQAKREIQLINPDNMPGILREFQSITKSRFTSVSRS